MPIMPTDPFAEMEAIGSILRSPELMTQIVGEQLFGPRDFHTPEHQAIAQAVFDLDRHGRPISSTAIASWLNQQGTLDMVGGLTYIDSLRDRSGNINQITEALNNVSLSRELTELGALMSMRALEEGRDPNHVLDEMEQRLYSLRRGNQSQVSSIGQVLGSWRARFEQRRAGEAAGMFVPRFEPLGRLIGGIERNDFVIIGGRPGDGKSTWLKWLAYLTAIQPPEAERQGVYIGDFEEGEHIFVAKFISMITGISLELIKHPDRLTDPEVQRIMEAFETLDHAPIYFNSMAAPTPQVYKNKVMEAERQCQQDFRVGLAFHSPDYIQQMTGVGDNDQSKAASVSKFVRGMCQPDQVGIPCIATAQLNRTPVDSSGRPREYQQTDLKETGRLEQDATMILFTIRPWIMSPPTPDTVRAYPQNVEQDGSPSDRWRVEPVQVKVDKNRNGPSPVKSTLLLWHKYNGTFTNAN